VVHHEEHPLPSRSRGGGRLLVRRRSGRRARYAVAKGEVAQPHTFVSLVAAVNATPATVEALKARAAIKETEVKLVNAAPLITNESDSALTAALEKNAKDIEQLRSVLGAQAAITDALAKADPKLTIADVIAADVHVDGSIDLFYRPKAM
jgi:hypothetical protein